MKKFFALLIACLFAQYISAETSAAKKVDRYLNKAVQNGFSGSVLIAMNGNVLLKEGYGMADREKKVSFTAETVFDIGSITKQFTAACILKLEMQGKLNVQDPITKFFDAVPGEKKKITLHQLLTHTAGLPGSLGMDEERIGKEEYLRLVFLTPLIHPPGTFDYSNVGFSLLAAVVEKVTGKDYEHYLREQILLPAGMRQTGYVLPGFDKAKIAIGYEGPERWGTTYDMSQYDKGITWHLKGNGGMHSTVVDMHLWYVALRGNAVLPETVKQKYFAPHTKIQDDSFYAYGWRVSKNARNEKVIAHNGGNGYFMATFRMVPQADFNIVVSTNDATKNTDRIATRIERILFDNLEELSDAFVKTFQGEYWLPSGASIPVSFNENDEAILLLNQAEPWSLFGGADSDDPKQVEKFNQKTALLLQNLFAGNMDQVMALSGLPKQEVTDMTTGFRDRLEKQFGNCKEPKILESVSRQNGRYYLTLVDMNCDRRHFRTTIWQGERLFDFRPLPEGNTKPFEYINASEFYSENNNRRIQFEQQNGAVLLKMKTGSKQIVARKK